MDEAYLRPSGEKRRWGRFLLLVLVVLIVAASIFFLVGRGKKIISPVPPKASFEVTFYTPTPLPISPSSTPSATPKGKKAPSATPSVKVTPKATATPTVKSSPSPTVKPT
jgi:hypothetical protein